MNRNIEKWAYLGYEGGVRLGTQVIEEDLSAMRRISVHYALQCIMVYAIWRVAGGDPDAPQ